MPTRTEVETLRATISGLRDALDRMTEQALRLQFKWAACWKEKCDLECRLHRKWNGIVPHHRFRCPLCQRWVRLLEAQLAMNDEILYVVGECKRHGRVTPTGCYNVDDIKAALPKEG